MNTVPDTKHSWLRRKMAAYCIWLMEQLKAMECSTAGDRLSQALDEWLLEQKMGSAATISGGPKRNT